MHLEHANSFQWDIRGRSVPISLPRATVRMAQAETAVSAMLVELAALAASGTQALVLAALLVGGEHFACLRTVSVDLWSWCLKTQLAMRR